MMKKNLYIFPLAVVVGLTSCGDDDDNGPAQNRTELLTAKTWRMTNLEGQVNGQTTSYWNFVFDACEQDDESKFNADGTYVLTDTGEECSPDNSETGTWAFNADQTVLTVATLSDTISGKVESMSASEFKVSEMEVVNGMNTKLIITFKAL